MIESEANSYSEIHTERAIRTPPRRAQTEIKAQSNHLTVGTVSHIKLGTGSSLNG